MNQAETIKFAREYLYKPLYPKIGYSAFDAQWKMRYEQPMKEKVPFEAVRLHRNLQYYLCGWFDRFDGMFGEVTRKDVAQAVEAWIFANTKEYALQYHSSSDPNYLAMFDENGELKDGTRTV